MRLHILGHVEAHQLDAKLHRQLAGDLGLADAGRPGKQEAADRLVAVTKTGTRHLDGGGQRVDGRILPEDHHLQVAVEVTQHVAIRRADLLLRNPRHARDDLLDLGDADDRHALVLGQQALARTGLIDHVDGLVRQQAVANMLHRQVHCSLQCFAAVGNAVMFLEARLQAFEDLHGFGHRRLDHVDLLEAPCQRAVFLEHATVFLERGRTDTAQLTRCQHRLDQVAGIHGATGCRTGTDDGVDFVDEQHRARMLLQLGQHRLQALLEIAAILGAGDQRTEVQREDGGIGQHFRHFAIDDALGQAFRQRGLADAGLAHVKRVVLATTAQHLDGALDLLGTADQRVDLVLQRQFVEVVGELGQRIALAFLGGLAFLAAFGIRLGG